MMVHPAKSGQIRPGGKVIVFTPPTSIGSRGRNPMFQAVSAIHVDPAKSGQIRPSQLAVGSGPHHEGSSWPKLKHPSKELVSMIERGDLRLPEMQRCYVWRSTRVRGLLVGRKGDKSNSRSRVGGIAQALPNPTATSARNWTYPVGRARCCSGAGKPVDAIQAALSSAAGPPFTPRPVPPPPAYRGRSGSAAYKSGSAAGGLRRRPAPPD
jgi:hypothetical protein